MSWEKDKVFQNGQEFVEWLEAEYGEFVAKHISSIDVHHTYIPDHSFYPERTTLQMHKNMRDYHISSRGWNDIGQHATIGKEGNVVLGLPIEKTPASALGFNGTSAWHPFMYEMIGNFDKGNDKLEGAQLDTVNAINNYFHVKKGKQMRFHREMAPKSCPGTGIEKSWMIEQAKMYKTVSVPQVEKRSGWLMEPVKFSVGEFDKALVRVLARFEQKDPALSKVWREKYQKGELTGMDLLGLIVSAIDRDYIVGKGE